MGKAPKLGRTNDPERTRAEILDVATSVFAEMGYSGSSIEILAEKMNASKRMIYYYFESKEGLYKSVLLKYYQTLRGDEARLELDHRAPLDALRELVGFTFDYHVAHPDHVRLSMVENIHKGRHISELAEAESLNSAAIDVVRKICERGVAAGLIRPDVRAIDIYLSIAAMSFFNVSNRYTVERIFGYDMAAPASSEARKRCIVDMILRYVLTDKGLKALPS